MLNVFMAFRETLTNHINGYAINKEDSITVGADFPHSAMFLPDKKTHTHTNQGLQ